MDIDLLARALVTLSGQHMNKNLLPEKEVIEKEEEEEEEEQSGGKCSKAVAATTMTGSSLGAAGK